MNRLSLQQLSRDYQEDASVLLKSERWRAAYYLLGHALECALKACICKQFGHHEFPEKKFVQRIHSHDPSALLDAAGLSSALKSALRGDPAFERNWSTAKDWSVETRYNLLMSRVAAEALFTACVSEKHGVLPWIKERW